MRDTLTPCNLNFPQHNIQNSSLLSGTPTLLSSTQWSYFYSWSSFSLFTCLTGQMPFTKEQRIICKKSWNVFLRAYCVECRVGLIKSRSVALALSHSSPYHHSEPEPEWGILYLSLIPELSSRRDLRADWRVARPGCVVNSHTLCCVMIIHRI